MKNWEIKEQETRLGGRWKNIKLQLRNHKSREYKKYGKTKAWKINKTEKRMGGEGTGFTGDNSEEGEEDVIEKKSTDRQRNCWAWQQELGSITLPGQKKEGLANLSPLGSRMAPVSPRTTLIYCIYMLVCLFIYILYVLVIIWQFEVKFIRLIQLSLRSDTSDFEKPAPCCYLIVSSWPHCPERCRPSSGPAHDYLFPLTDSCPQLYLSLSVPPCPPGAPSILICDLSIPPSLHSSAPSVTPGASASPYPPIRQYPPFQHLHTPQGSNTMAFRGAQAW